MSGFETTDLRSVAAPVEVGPCEARYGGHFCSLIAGHGGSHVETRQQQATWDGSILTVQWKAPMTPRREPVEPLTTDEILDALSNNEWAASDAGLWIGGRPFREVT